MVSNCHDEDDHMVADLLLPGGLSSSALVNEVLDFQQPGFFQKVILYWDCVCAKPLTHETFLILNTEDLPHTHGHAYKIDDSSVPIPIHAKTGEKLRVLEMFGGAIGGWACAINFLRKTLNLESQLVAIDSDIHAVYNYAMTHGATIVDAHKPLDRFALNDMEEDVILHGSIDSHGWLPAVAEWAPQLVTMSAPCPPWSAAGGEEGLDSWKVWLWQKQSQHA